MFFVGATGQLITLLLTVCLPLVLLLSGNPQADVQSPANYFSSVQIQHVITVTEKAMVHKTAEFVKTETQQPFVFHYRRVKQKIPLRNSFIRWDAGFLASSGNKAPPVQFNFSC